MIDKTSLITTVTQRLKKLPLGHCLDIRTFKRNRSVAIIHSTENTFTIIEDGFHQERWDNLLAGDVKRILKGLLKREFPRSHKVRIYTLESYDEANVNRMGYGQENLAQMELPTATRETNGLDSSCKSLNEMFLSKTSFILALLIIPKG